MFILDRVQSNRALAVWTTLCGLGATLAELVRLLA